MGLKHTGHSDQTSRDSRETVGRCRPGCTESAGSHSVSRRKKGEGEVRVLHIALDGIGASGLGCTAVTQLAPAAVPKILEAMGLEPRVLPDEKTWRCTLNQAMPNDTIRLVVRYGGAWLYLSIIPFFEPSSIRPWGQGKFPVGFLGRLLAVNRNLILVKFALDDDGDVVLRAELPTEALSESEVETAARMLIDTTAQYRDPVRRALQDAARAQPPATS